MKKNKKTTCKDKRSFNKLERIYVFTKQHGKKIVEKFGFPVSKVTELVEYLNLYVVMWGHSMQINATKAPTRSEETNLVDKIEKQYTKLHKSLETLKQYDITMIKQINGAESLMSQVVATAKERSKKPKTKGQNTASRSLSKMINELRKAYELVTGKIARDNIKHNGSKDTYSGEFLEFTAYCLSKIKEYENSEELFGYIPDTDINSPHNNIGKTILNALQNGEDYYVRVEK